MPQSLASVLVHLVFSTRDRERLISREIESELHSYMATIFLDLGSHSLAGNGTEDHVHFLFSLSRTVTLAKVVEEVKKGSSKWIKTKGPAFRDFAWQAGYGAFSVSESAVEAVRGYIATQKEHHRKRTFQEEMRLFLKKHKVEYDERYIWD